MDLQEINEGRSRERGERGGTERRALLGSSRTDHKQRVAEIAETLDDQSASRRVAGEFFECSNVHKQGEKHVAYGAENDKTELFLEVAETLGCC